MRNTPPSETVEARLRRRLEVCDRLKILALETNDPRLEQSASELEDLVWKWYWEEQRRRGGSARTNSPSPSAPATSSGADTRPPRRSHSPEAAPPEVDVQPSNRSRPPIPTSAAAPSGIPQHERLDRLDMHTIRGSAPDHPVPEVELAPHMRSDFRTQQEIRQ